MTGRRCYFYNLRLGMLLIEVLLAQMLFSTVLLGLISAQAIYNRQIKHHLYKTIAISQLRWMVENLRSSYPILHTYDRALLRVWMRQNRALLPQGEGYIHCQACQCQVHVTWHHDKSYELGLTIAVCAV